MKNHYLFHIQFLGFRYHGWLKQPGYKTVQAMVEKTFEFLFQHNHFKTLGCSRTDAKVSANHYVFELFTDEDIDATAFLPRFNKNLPNDIRALKIEKTTSEFNIIHAAKAKEYLYLFTHGQKNNPFCAAQVMSIDETLDLDLMRTGAAYFAGTHDFRRYCAEPKPGQNFIRTIDVCEIIPNTLFTANFFPEQTYFFRVKSNGFLRYQVRLMMGQLISLGKGESTLADLKETLSGSSDVPVRHIGPSSGLILNAVEFN
ncbi:MAG: tRNA pseudouridine(38-40) synthase TruA [Bacteroidetes bacterium]|nr:tRNA pseudouridine(38-40) synthase TruA [Bacteroidota bacterium]